ncbi:MAG: hypothetical protein GAK45_02229 [Pseudomonas citronellolis]|nr:MAG: hypothetical protein GAK45_02229 [Pseudomonas citronellolis]
MLIVPAEHPLDWQKPPLITLALILLNCLIFFFYQGGDEARQQAAVEIYLQEGLLARERPLFSASFARRENLGAEQQRQLEQAPRQQLAWLVLRDLEFAHELRSLPAFTQDAAWQAARQKAEQARDRISSLRFGLIPAQLTVQGLIGSMFLHGDFWHLAGNMVFLFLFGFALEVALGRAVYLGLYLLAGICSGLLWWALDPVWITGIGASGAISGLMGMYIGLYGLRRIRFFYWLGPMIGYFSAPALWILPLWMGKELYGLLRAADHVNYYAHLGGLASGFLLVWLPRRVNRLKVDEAYLTREDPDAPFRRELYALDAQIGRFELQPAALRGAALLERYPGRLELIERLYTLARTRQDRTLLSPVLKQLFALPQDNGSAALLRQVADDSALPLLQHPALQLHLLHRLLQLADAPRALAVWQRLSQWPQRPAQLPALTLSLANLLSRTRHPKGLGELFGFLESAYPQAEQTRELAQLMRTLRPV